MINVTTRLRLSNTLITPKYFSGGAPYIHRGPLAKHRLNIHTQAGGDGQLCNREGRGGAHAYTHSHSEYDVRSHETLH